MLKRGTGFGCGAGAVVRTLLLRAHRTLLLGFEGEIHLPEEDNLSSRSEEERREKRGILQGDVQHCHGKVEELIEGKQAEEDL